MPPELAVTLQVLDSILGLQSAALGIFHFRSLNLGFRTTASLQSEPIIPYLFFSRKPFCARKEDLCVEIVETQELIESSRRIC